MINAFFMIKSCSCKIMTVQYKKKYYEFLSLQGNFLIMIEKSLKSERTWKFDELLSDFNLLLILSFDLNDFLECL